MIGSILVQRLLNPCIKKIKYQRDSYPWNSHMPVYTITQKTCQYAQYTHWFSLMHTFTSHTHLHTHICIHTHHRHILYPGNKSWWKSIKRTSRELQLMQSSQVIFSIFLQHRNSYHYDIIGIVVRSCCILNTFSVTTIFYWTQSFMISYNYVVVMLLVPQDPRCGPC